LAFHNFIVAVRPAVAKAASKKIIAYLKARGFTSASVEETRHQYVKVRPWRNVGGHYIDL
jgi:hypothetical protein